jgi:hypothetical protein
MALRANILSKKPAVLLMLLVMSFIIGNKVFFIHTHLDSYGNIITHSHPYNKNSDKLPVKSHHHTQAVLAFIGMAEQSVMPSESIGNECPDSPVATIYITYFNSYTLPDLSTNQGRGPPVI